MKRRLMVAGVFLLLTPLLWAAAQNPVETAQGQFQAGHFAPAATVLQQAIEKDPGNAALYYWLGRCYYELKNYERASDEVGKAVKLDEQDSDYHFWLGRIYGKLAATHHSLWLGIRTRKEFESAVQINPGNIAARRALVEFYTGAPWIVGGSKSKAQREVAAIAARDPVQGELARADYDHMVGNLAGARESYQKVLATDNATPVEYYEAADFFASQRDATELRRAVDDVLHVAPSDPRLGYYRGVLLTIQGDQLTEAESYLKAYLASTVDRSDYPPHADARTWLGHVYQKMGRQLEAAEQYRAALEIDPNSGFAKQSLKHLEKQMN